MGTTISSGCHRRVLWRSSFERAGFRPSVLRWNAPPKVRFAIDSALEGNGFELSVPHKTCSGFEASSEFGADRLSARRNHPGSRRPRQKKSGFGGSRKPSAANEGARAV